MQKLVQLRSRITQTLDVPNPGKSCASSSGRAGEKVYASALKTLGAHQLAPARKRDAHYSSRRGPRCGLAGRAFSSSSCINDLEFPRM